MVYALAFFATFFLFSIWRVFKSYSMSNDIERARRISSEKEKEAQKYKSIAADRERKINELAQQITELKKTAGVTKELDKTNESLKKQLSSLRFESQAQDEAYAQLLKDYNKLEELAIHYHHALISMRRGETWHDLISREGNERFLISQEEESTISYPVFHPEKVYYAPVTGKRFHAVPWCYSLDSSSVVEECSYHFARTEKRLSPCRLCVDKKQVKAYEEKAH